MSLRTFNEIKSNIRSMKIFPSVEVTPEMAAEMMKLNKDNRTLDERRVILYTDIMKKNQWVFNGDLIRFSRSSKLSDGQHRLMAVIKSGKTQVWNIQTGLPDEVFDTLDTGKNRTGGDVLSIKGYKNPNDLARAIKLIRLYDNGWLGSSKGIDPYQRGTNHTLTEWLEKHGDNALVESMEFAGKLYSKSRLLSKATICAFLYMFARKDKERAKIFFDLLITGEDLSSTKNSMIFNLREKLIKSSMSRKELLFTDEKYALIIKAWNNYRDGRESKRLGWNVDSESFPKIK